MTNSAIRPPAKPIATPVPDTRPRRGSGATTPSSAWYWASALLNPIVAIAATTSASRIESTTPSSPVANTLTSVNAMRIGLWRPMRSASAPSSGSSRSMTTDTDATMSPT